MQQDCLPFLSSFHDCFSSLNCSLTHCCKVHCACAFSFLAISVLDCELVPIWLLVYPSVTYSMSDTILIIADRIMHASALIWYFQNLIIWWKNINGSSQSPPQKINKSQNTINNEFIYLLFIIYLLCQSYAQHLNSNLVWLLPFVPHHLYLLFLSAFFSLHSFYTSLRFWTYVIHLAIKSIKLIETVALWPIYLCRRDTCTVMCAFLCSAFLMNYA